MTNDESSWKLTQAYMDLHGELKMSCGPEKNAFTLCSWKKWHFKDNLFKTDLHSAQKKIVLLHNI